MEKRASPRYEAENRVCVSLFPLCCGDSMQKVFFCKTDDLSLEGLRLSGDASFEPGQLLELLVICGSAYKGFEFTGRVAWVKPSDHDGPSSLGIQFIDMKESTRLAWQEVLDRIQHKV